MFDPTQQLRQPMPSIGDTNLNAGEKNKIMENQLSSSFQPKVVQTSDFAKKQAKKNIDELQKITGKNYNIEI